MTIKEADGIIDNVNRAIHSIFNNMDNRAGYIRLDILEAGEHYDQILGHGVVLSVCYTHFNKKEKQGTAMLRSIPIEFKKVGDKLSYILSRLTLVLLVSGDILKLIFKRYKEVMGEELSMHRDAFFFIRQPNDFIFDNNKDG